jgi:hypothetical protein
MGKAGWNMDVWMMWNFNGEKGALYKAMPIVSPTLCPVCAPFISNAL